MADRWRELESKCTGLKSAVCALLSNVGLLGTFFGVQKRGSSPRTDESKLPKSPPRCEEDDWLRSSLLDHLAAEERKRESEMELFGCLVADWLQ